MDNLSIQPSAPSGQIASPPPQVNDLSQTPLTDPLQGSEPSAASTQPISDLNRTVSDGMVATPEAIAQAVTNTNNDPGQPRFENGELKPPNQDPSVSSN